eukprot:gene9627-20010_t
MSYLSERLAKEYVYKGNVFKQCWQYIPSLEPFYTEFENRFALEPMHSWMLANPIFPVITICFYLLFCYFGGKFMKQYKGYDLKYQLAAWNLFLSLFSAWGTFRTAPHLLYNIMNRSFENTVCDAPINEWGIGATGFAVQMFILSKFPELIDTVFIVLKKKPLIFLHWYHHVTVLLYCWNAYVTEAATGLYFVVMNYTVHAIMYFYYFLASLKLIPKWFPSWIITMLQISQMFIGIFIVGSAIYYYNYGGKEYAPQTCSNKMSNMTAGAVMYLSYALLFLAFAFERFLFPRKKSSVRTKKIE